MDGGSSLPSFIVPLSFLLTRGSFTPPFVSEWGPHSLTLLTEQISQTLVRLRRDGTRSGPRLYSVLKRVRPRLRGHPGTGSSRSNLRVIHDPTYS